MFTDFLIAFPFCIGFVEMVYGYEVRRARVLNIRDRIIARIEGHHV